MIELTNEELNRMRTDTENHFVERKTASDKGGWLRTAVAFANSAPIGDPAVLFVGVNNDGTLQKLPVDHNWEKHQKTVTEQLNRAYPPLYYLCKIVRDPGGHEFLAVVVPGSPQRPHFTGKSYIRIGPQTIEASDEQFEKLIAQRLSKVYEIQKRKGEEVTVEWLHRNVSAHVDPSQGTLGGVIEECNVFWVTIRRGEQLLTHPLSLVDLSFDTNRGHLKLWFWKS